MYICNNCGNCDKFIGYVHEKGKAYIYQNNNNADFIQKDNEINLSNNYTASDEIVSERFSWTYFLSDKNWKSSWKIKKCSCCNSRDISWI